VGLSQKHTVDLGAAARWAVRQVAGQPRLDSVEGRVTEMRLRTQRARGSDHGAVRALVHAHGPQVNTGPFKGLRYGPLALRFGDRLAAKLLGSYECELHEALDRIVVHDYPILVNVGAADGYYAVGFAYATASSVIAYESEPFARRLCRETARENGLTDRVDVRGTCIPSEFARLDLPAGALVMLDCEGCEDQLVDLDRLPALRHATIVVELHDFVDPGVSDRLIARVEATHRVDVINARPRYPLEWPMLMSLPGLTHLQRELAVNELRPAPMRWAVCSPAQ
jgi:hypothetical protein